MSGIRDTKPAAGTSKAPLFRGPRATIRDLRIRIDHAMEELDTAQTDSITTMVKMRCDPECVPPRNCTPACHDRAGVISEARNRGIVEIERRLCDDLGVLIESIRGGDNAAVPGEAATTV